MRQELIKTNYFQAIEIDFNPEARLIWLVFQSQPFPYLSINWELFLPISIGKCVAFSLPFPFPIIGRQKLMILLFLSISASSRWAFGSTFHFLMNPLSIGLVNWEKLLGIQLGVAWSCCQLIGRFEASWNFLLERSSNIFTDSIYSQKV